MQTKNAYLFASFFLFEKGLDLAAKPLGKVGLSSSNQVRKRLSRKSPGPELRKTLRSIPPPTNVTGPETVCLFVFYFHFLHLT